MPSKSGKRCEPGCQCGHHTRKYPSEDERWSKYAPNGDPGECWEWRGGRTPFGHGLFTMTRDGKKRSRIASRVAMIRAGHELGPDDCVLHHCDNPPCVNPGHLYIGDRKRNAQDCAERDRTNKRGYGETHWSAKYTDAEVEEWKRRHEAGEPFKAIARTTDAHHTTVSRSVRGLQRGPTLRRRGGESCEQH